MAAHTPQGEAASERGLHSAAESRPDSSTITFDPGYFWDILVSPPSYGASDGSSPFAAMSAADDPRSTLHVTTKFVQPWPDEQTRLVSQVDPPFFSQPSGTSDDQILLDDLFSQFQVWEQLVEMRFIRNIVSSILLGLAAAAYDPALDSECASDGICLSSFKWCRYDAFNPSGDDCDWPQGASSLWASGAGARTALLESEYGYDIAWRHANGSLPVTIRWLSSLPDEMPGKEDDQGLRTIYATNLTANKKMSGTYRFTPQTILDAYRANPMPGITMEAAWLMARTRRNVITISQPGASSDAPADSSHNFLLADAELDQVLADRRQASARDLAASQKRWGIGVGVGVGIGLPLVVALTWIAACRKATGRKVWSVRSSDNVKFGRANA
ncbi:hypothetical protein ACHAO2_006470 [Verticillium nonalfalfae]